MLQLWQITAEFSNAVLIVVLPYVADFAKKLDLPGMYSTNSVLVFRCDPRVGPMAQIGGWITFTNHYEFWFDHGHVNGFRNPGSYYELQDPAHIPNFFGKVNLTEKEALRFARKKIKALGYSLADLNVDQSPVTTSPVHTRGGVVPRYLFEWEDPLVGIRNVRIEINAEKLRLEKLFLLPPKHLLPDPPKIPPEILAQRPPGRLPTAYGPFDTNAILKPILELLPAYIKRMGLPIRPPKLADVKMLGHWDSVSEYSVRLGNRWTFVSLSNRITGFYAPKCYFQYSGSADEPRPARDFIGKWKIGEAQARKIAEAALRKADPTNMTVLLNHEPDVQKPKEIGIYVIPRYLFSWQDARTRSQAQVEVDASNGTIRYLYVLASLSPSPDPLPERVPSKKVETVSPFE